MPAIALAAGLVVTVPGPERSVAAPEGPNILVIVSDDQASSTFSPELMPAVFSRIADPGVLFRRAYANTALCCPSRAQMLTGLYEHHTGVDGNNVPLERPTIVDALHDLGYRTMLAGKYLNSWKTCDPRPEFDRWACTSTPPPATYSLQNPYLNVDGVWQRFSGFQTDVLAEQVVSFVKETPIDQPFFALYAPTSPHLPADDPRYGELAVVAPRGAGFDADTLRPGAPLYARRPPLTPDEIARSDSRFERMTRAVRSLDDAVGTLLDAIDALERDTLVVYLSDNGFLYGEHRRIAKTDAYEESVRVPMAIRLASVTDGGRVSHALVANVDLAPTLADVAGIPWEADGRSLMPLLSGAKTSVRTAVPVEHCRGVNRWTLQCSGLNYFGGQTRASGFEGVVTSRFKYVRYDDGSRLLVDLQQDPSELVNLVDDPGHRRVRDALQRRLAQLLGPRPATTIVTGPSEASHTVAPAFTFFSPSRLSTYRCRLTRSGRSEPWRDCSGGIDVVGPLADGQYVFEVAGTDELGNTDRTPARRAFTVGSSGPQATISSHPPAAQTERTASFSFTRGEGVQCRLRPAAGTAPWRPCSTGTATFDGLADGWWVFEVRTRTGDGPLTDPAAAWPFRVDATGPAFVAATSPAFTNDRTVRLRFAPTEPVPGPVTCTLNRREPVDCTSGSFVTPQLKKGTHAVVVTAVDALGNQGVTSLSWTLDIGGPRFHIGARPDRFSSSTTARFRVASVSDVDAVFLCAVDGGPEMPCAQTIELGPFGEGTHTFTAWAFDAARNRTGPRSYRWTIDTLPPGLLISGTPEDGAVSSSRTASFDVWTNEPADLFCSLDGSEFSSCEATVAYANLADGAHAFEVYAVDRAGNRSITAGRAWTVSASAPALRP